MGDSAEIQLDGKRICLVTSGHIATDPRIVKEANALVSAGVNLTVVSAPFTAHYKAHDLALAEDSGWRHVAVDTTREVAPIGYALRALRQKAFLQFPRATWRLPTLAEAAFSRVTTQLDTALRQYAPDAEFYLAHNLAALPAAAAAASRSRGKLGVDLEDCHWGEYADGDDSRQRALARHVEDRYLPRCQHLTAASPMIAAHYEQRLGRPVTPILNVFPLAERPPILRSGPVERAGEPLTMYWFSQTLGPGRGLEWVIAALRRVKTPVRLVLRGQPVAGYLDHLWALARQAGAVVPGLEQRIEFLPIVPPQDLVVHCARYDIGLSVEDGLTLNHRLCLGNKIFYYLLAGLPVILSDTPAQIALAKSLGEAAVVAPYGDADGLAQAILPWLSNPDRLREARHKAWSLATTRYNWESEQTLFLNSVRNVLK